MAVKSQIFKRIFDKNQSGVNELNEKFDQFIEKHHFQKPIDENVPEYLNYAIFLEKFLIQFLNLKINQSDERIQEIYSARRLIEKNFKNTKDFEKIEIVNYLDEFDLSRKILKNNQFDKDDEKYILNILNNEKYKEYKRNSLLF